MIEDRADMLIHLRKLIDPRLAIYKAGYRADQAEKYRKDGDLTG